jgi:hypothetical protein
LPGADWWVIGIPLLVGLWFWLGWWVFVLVAVGVWATIDYLRRGQQVHTIIEFDTAALLERHDVTISPINSGTALSSIVSIFAA